MDSQQHPRPAELSRPLVAADPGIDPHRLVRVLCERAGAEPLGVTLLIPVDDESQPWSASTRAAERLLHHVDVLLDAAGVNLEEVIITDGARLELGKLARLGGFDALLVCARDDTAPAGVLPLAARLARRDGLEVIESGGRSDHPGWLRRVVSPLLHWQRPRERAT